MINKIEGSHSLFCVNEKWERAREGGVNRAIAQVRFDFCGKILLDVILIDWEGLNKLINVKIHFCFGYWYESACFFLKLIWKGCIDAYAWWLKGSYVALSACVQRLYEFLYCLGWTDFNDAYNMWRICEKHEILYYPCSVSLNDWTDSWFLYFKFLLKEWFEFECYFESLFGYDLKRW